MFEQGIATRAQLRDTGVTDRQLATAVAAGTVIRARRGLYVRAGVPEPLLQAVRVGGRLACVSALRAHGVFGFDTDLHVHLEHSASRLRPRGSAHLHWWPLMSPPQGHVVGIVDALAQAMRCQLPHHAIASVDSALHLRLVTEHEVDDLFASLPRKLRGMRRLVDGRAEAGQETVLRLALRKAGLTVRPQVTFPGIGRVDLLVDERLVVEADSRSAHDGWELHVRDRDRDIDLARRGRMSLRPGYNRTMFATHDVVEAATVLLGRKGRVKSSGRTRR